MNGHRIRAGLMALAVLAAAACGTGPTQPDAPKEDVEEGDGKRGVVSAVVGQG